MKAKRPTTLKQAMPRTPEQWAAHRCKLSCKIGRAALEGKAELPTGTSRLEYAVYNLLHAIEDLAEVARQNVRISNAEK